MELFLKITTTLLLLLLVSTFQPAMLQEETTDTPRRTIAKSWLRELAPQKNADQQPLESESSNQLTEDNGMESSTDYSGGIPSGSMLYGDEGNINETMEYPTQPPTFPNETNVQAEFQDSNVSATTQAPTSEDSQVDVDKENSTAVPETFTTKAIPQNSSTDNDLNSTDVHATTQAPDINATNTPTVDLGTGFTNETESNNTGTTAAPVPEIPEQDTTTAAVDKPSTISSEPEESTTTTTTIIILLETTTIAPATLDRANLSEKGGDFGGTAERGFTDSEHRRRKSAWGAVLGTFVAVAIVGLVAYVILKKKHQKAFSHRKLDEEFPSDPVLRLDNSEPLDLNFGRGAYYNPTLQGDDIQMRNFPKN